MNGYPYLDDLALQARDLPGGAALILPDRTLTWLELDHAADQYALQSRSNAPTGSHPASRLFLPPGEEAIVALHALPRLGAYAVPLDPRLSVTEARDLFAALDMGQPENLQESADPSQEVVWVEPHADRVRTNMLTSGSSGAPKPVPLTFASHRAAAESARQLLELTEDDRWLACLPFHHIGGLSIFTRSAYVGFPAIVTWPFDAAEVMDSVERHHATAISLVPTMLRRLIDANWEPPATLRFALLGGAASPISLQKEALDRGIPIAPSYGMTETCSQICTLLPDEVAAHIGTVGRPIPGAAVMIRDDDRVAAQAEQTGRIWARSPDSSAWIETGDLGAVDLEGYLTVVGRADEMIVTGGEKVAPAEIENLLALRADVAEAAVIGIADPEWGERVVAAVVAGRAGSPDPESLRSYLRESLAPFKVPRSVVVVAELPRTGPGKVDRGMLRNLIADNFQRGRRP